MASSAEYADVVVVPRIAVTLPMPLPLPEGFESDRLETWPPVAGRVELVAGRLLYMPPCGDEQQDTAADVLSVVHAWRRAHRDFVVGGNEAAMLLGGDVRAADVAVWRRSDLSAYSGRLRRVAPILAVEVAGVHDTADGLAAKSRWYLEHGVVAVWVLWPVRREVDLTTAEGTATFGLGETLPSVSLLPGLAPLVDDLFEQISERY